MTYDEYIHKIADVQREMRESKRAEKNRCREINETFRQDCAKLKAGYLEAIAQLDRDRKLLIHDAHNEGISERTKLFFLQSKLSSEYKSEHKLPPPVVELVTADEQKEQ